MMTASGDVFWDDRSVAPVLGAVQNPTMTFV